MRQFQNSTPEMGGLVAMIGVLAEVGHVAALDELDGLHQGQYTDAAGLEACGSDIRVEAAIDKTTLARIIGTAPAPKQSKTRSGLDQNSLSLQ